MEELNSNQSQSPPHIIEKPTAVWVFGILNIAVGCYQLMRVLFELYKIIAVAYANQGTLTGSEIAFLFLLLSNTVFAGWLIALGIGLLRMKKWARLGSVLYAWIMILLVAVRLVAPYSVMFIRRSSFPEDMRGRIVFIILIALIRNLTYPILLLIFM